jgi:hypothetical protein
MQSLIRQFPRAPLASLHIIFFPFIREMLLFFSIVLQQPKKITIQFQFALRWIKLSIALVNVSRILKNFDIFFLRFLDEEIFAQKLLIN